MRKHSQPGPRGAHHRWADARCGWCGKFVPGWRHIPMYFLCSGCADPETGDVRKELITGEPQPRALGWVNPDRNGDYDRDVERVERLGARLGYRLVWPDETSVLPVSAHLHSLGADTVLMPAPDHLGPLELSRVMEIADVETVNPRLSFARWSIAGAVAGGGSC